MFKLIISFAIIFNLFDGMVFGYLGDPSKPSDKWPDWRFFHDENFADDSTPVDLKKSEKNNDVQNESNYDPEASLEFVKSKLKEFKQTKSGKNLNYKNTSSIELIKLFHKIKFSIGGCLTQDEFEEIKDKLIYNEYREISDILIKRNDYSAKDCYEIGSSLTNAHIYERAEKFLLKGLNKNPDYKIQLNIYWRLNYLYFYYHPKDINSLYRSEYYYIMMSYIYALNTPIYKIHAPNFKMLSDIYYNYSNGNIDNNK